MKLALLAASGLFTLGVVACGGPHAQMGHAALTPTGTVLPCSNSGNVGSPSGPCPTFASTQGVATGNNDMAKLNMSSADAGAKASPAP